MMTVIYIYIYRLFKSFISETWGMKSQSMCTTQCTTDDGYDDKILTDIYNHESESIKFTEICQN